MSMSRKDYVAVAAIIRAEILCYIGTQAEVAAVTIGKRMADYFQSDNPRFDRKKFLAACGIGV